MAVAATVGLGLFLCESPSALPSSHTCPPPCGCSAPSFCLKGEVLDGKTPVVIDYTPYLKFTQR